MSSRAPPFLIIDADTIARILERDRALLPGLVRDTYLDFGAGRAINPQSSFLSFNEIEPGSLDRIIALPAYLAGGAAIAGIKWISSFPANIDHGLPRASAAIILNDVRTGRPIACLEGSQISAARTAASAALGADLVCGGVRKLDRLGIVGGGVIASSILRSLSSQSWQFREIRVFDVSAERGRAFAEGFPDVCGTAVSVSSSLDRLLAESDLIVFATTAATPYVMDPGQFTATARLLNISLRDLGPDIILAADNIVDDVDHCLRANTSPHLAERQLGSRDFSLVNIHDCFTASGDRRWEPGERPAIFSPFGLGVLDLALAAHIYREACATGTVVAIDRFLPEPGRIG